MLVLCRESGALALVKPPWASQTLCRSEDQEAPLPCLVSALSGEPVAWEQPSETQGARPVPLPELGVLILR